MRRLPLLGSLLLATLTWVSGTAIAAPASVVLATETVTLTVDSDGVGSGEVTTVNLTDQPVSVTLTIAPAVPGCAIDPARFTLPAATQHSTKVTLKGCGIKDGKGVDIAVSVADSPLGTVKASTAEDSDTPDWAVLGWSFAISALVAGALIGVRFWKWTGSRPGPKTKLPGLGQDYDFSKSWATTATLASSSVAVIFGTSDILKSILGKNDKATVALLAVSAAVALGFVTAAPLAIAAFKADRTVTVGGLVLGAWLTLVGAGGQLGVLVWTAFKIELGDVLHVAAGIMGFLAAVLLCVYAWHSLKSAVKHGLEPPAKGGATKRRTLDEIKAAISTIDQGHGRNFARGDVDGVASLIKEVDDVTPLEVEVAATVSSRAPTAVL